MYVPAADTGGQKTVSDVIVQRLQDWGVDRLFGYSGDGIDGFIGAVQRSSGALEFVQARHEEMSAFMAVGHAKFTGRLGVCVSTQGPGAVHLLNGLYDAKLDHKPVLAIVGQQTQSVLGSGYQQEIDLQSLFKDACAQFCQTVADAQQVPMVIDRAVRIALTTMSPVCVVLPHDVQVMPAPQHPQEHGVMTSSAAISWPEVTPAAHDLRAAAAVVNAGSRVAVLIGQGARVAASEVAEFAELVGAGISYALMGKGIIDDDAVNMAGPLGHLGSTASWKIMQECDTLVMIGTNEPYTEFLPPPGAARAVQIDIDGKNVGYRYPTEVNLVGDSALTLRALLPLIERKPAEVWRHFVDEAISDWRNRRIRWAQQSANPLNPQLVFEELSSRLPTDAVLSIDVGSTTYWYARHVQMKPTMKSALSSTLASMGSAMPYGIAAKLAFPDRPVFALAGDGAMQMNGLAEMITLSRMWKRWRDPRFVMLVLNNGDLNEVSWEMREMEGNPRFAASQDLPPFRYAEYAELLGFIGMRLDSADLVGKIWDEALSYQHPVLVEAVVDPDVPLLAPHLDETHSANMLRSLDAEGADGASARELLLRQDEGQMTR
jgi:pyruvate dehydrogenase (quinone)